MRAGSMRVNYVLAQCITAFQVGYAHDRQSSFDNILFFLI
jgi:hypothetical protein